MFASIYKFWKRWNEAWINILLILLWPFAPAFYRFLDPTAAPLDAGVFSVIYLAMVAFSTGHLFIWIILKMNMKMLYQYFEGADIIRDFNNLPRWEKLKLAFGCFALYLFCWALVLMAVAQIA